jgi:hypothetical protein
MKKNIICTISPITTHHFQNKKYNAKYIKTLVTTNDKGILPKFFGSLIDLYICAVPSITDGLLKFVGIFFPPF